MILATLALVLTGAGAPQAQAPAAKGAPMSVDVQVAAKSGAGAHAWERELRTALEAHGDEFRLVKPGESAEAVVRVDTLAKGAGETSILNGALALGAREKAFNLTYSGDVRPQAEKLARNLRGLLEQLKTAPPPPPTPAPKRK